MSRTKLMLQVLTVLIVLAAATSLAHAQATAQATRTWVSGVGDDVNPCSRTAPCKTFAGAISKTASGGEINVLDPGGFGAVMITKAITISSEGFEAGVLVSGTNGIVVSVPNATDVVVLRGLDIEGLGTGLDGIKVITGGTVHVEKCTINHLTGSGINFSPTVANSQLHVVDTIIRTNGNFAGATGQGIGVTPSLAVKVMLNKVQMLDNVAGIKTQGSSTTSVSNSVAAGNAFAGSSAAAAAALLSIENSVAASNGTGVVCVGTVRLGNTTIAGSATALSGTCSSYKNNDIDVAVSVTPINLQ